MGTGLGTAGGANGAKTKLVAKSARPKHRKNIDDRGCSNSASQARQTSKSIPRHSGAGTGLGMTGEASGVGTKLVAEWARPKHRKNIDDRGCSNSASQARRTSKSMPRHSGAGTGLGTAGEAGARTGLGTAGEAGAGTGLGTADEAGAGTGLGTVGEASGAGTKLVAERARPKHRKNIDDQGCSNSAGQARRTSKSMPGHSGAVRDRPEDEDRAKDETIRLFGKTSNIGDIGVERRLTGGTDRVWIFIIRFPAGKESTNVTRWAQILWARLASREGEGEVTQRATTWAQSLWARLVSRERGGWKLIARF